MTQTGRPAFFRSGGQQADRQPDIWHHRSWRRSSSRFGTELEVLPIVYANGQIWLEINPRVTSVNTGLVDHDRRHVDARLRPSRTFVPPCMLESGQTFAIGGLIQNSVTATARKLPVLGELAVHWSRVSARSSTPRVRERAGDPGHPAPRGADELRPGSEAIAGRETRNPDDYELFLENILEAPRGQRKVWNGRCYNAAWKCDPTAAIFPCVGGVCTGGANGAGMARRVRHALVPVTPVPASPGDGPGRRFLPAPVAVRSEADSLPPVIVVPQAPGN